MKLDDVNYEQTMRLIDTAKASTEQKVFARLVVDGIFGKGQETFQIGDIVEVLEEYTGRDLKGKRGIVVHPFIGSSGVEFFAPPMGGHTCGGRARDKHGYYVETSKMKLVLRPVLKFIGKD